MKPDAPLIHEELGSYFSVFLLSRRGISVPILPLLKEIFKRALRKQTIFVKIDL
jgi:hypothetical protein